MKNLNQPFSALVVLAVTVVAALLTPQAQATRIKDISALSAARPNQLLGYGLVVGLQGTGDGKDISFTIQTLRETLARMGTSVDGPLSSYDLDPVSVKDFKVENVAAVMVTAELPAFAKPGQKIDVNVAAIAKAKSLRGGVLLMTRMRGPDGQTYAVAQGPLAASALRQMLPVVLLRSVLRLQRVFQAAPWLSGRSRGHSTSVSLSR